MATPISVLLDDSLNDTYRNGDQLDPAGAAFTGADGVTRIVSAWRDAGVDGGAIRFEVGVEDDLEDLYDNEATVDAPGPVVGGPDVVSFADGTFAILWTGLDPATGEPRAYEQRFAFDPDERTVAAQAGPVDLGPAADVAAVDLAGGVHAVLAASAEGVVLRVVADADAAAGVPIVLTSAAGAGGDPDLAAVGGRVVAAFEDGAGGVRLAVANPATGSATPGPTIAGAGAPALAALADGRVALAFVENGAAKVRLFTVGADGSLTAVGPDVVAPRGSGAGGAQSAPDVVALPDGGFVLGWSEGTPEGPEGFADGLTILGQRFGADGRPLGEVFEIGDDDDERETGLAFVDAGDGRFTALYGTTDAGGDSSGLGVGGGSFVAPGLVAGTAGADFIAGTARAEVIDAGDGNDTVHGGGGRDTIRGGGGNDVLYALAPDADAPDGYAPAHLLGGGGDDRLVGGFSSRLDGGEGDDILDGGARSDTLDGGAGDDTLRAGDGDDEIRAGAGADVVDGGAGTETITLVLDGVADRIDAGEHSPWEYDTLHVDVAGYGPVLVNLRTDTVVLPDGTTVTGVERFYLESGSGNDTLIGDHQRDGSYVGDTLRGRGGNDSLDAGSGDDDLDGGAGADTVLGGSGNDVVGVKAGEGGDLLDGGSNAWGDDEDSLVLTFQDDTAGLSGDLSGTGGRLSDGTRATNFERISAYLGSGHDDLTLGDGNDYVTGGGGDDRLSTGGGDDTIDGGGGADTINAGAGNDSINVNGGEHAGDVIDGGAGHDVLEVGFQYNKGGITLDMSGPVFSFGPGTRVENVEEVRFQATEHADDLRFGARADLISGRGGDDTLDGGAGDDTIFGWDGADRITAGAGDDFVGVDLEVEDGELLAEVADGGEGDRDTLNLGTSLVPSGVGVVVDMTTGSVTVGGATGAVRVTGFEHLRMSGTLSDDSVVGGEGADSISGWGGADTIEGRGGDDTIYGGSRASLLDGGDGNDSLWGSGGADTIAGGAGANRIDAEAGDDRILSSGYDGIEGGDGRDTVVFAKGRADYDVGYDEGSRAYVVTDRETGVEARVSAVEFFEFADRTLAAAEVIQPPPEAFDDRDRLGEDEVRLDRAAAAGVLADDFAIGTRAVAGVAPGAEGTDFVGTWGTLTLRADGSYAYVLSAAAQALGAGEVVTDAFAYALSDGRGGTDEGSLTIEVTGANDRAAPGDDRLSGTEDTPLVVDAAALLANDRDPDRTDALTLVGVGGAVGGTVALDGQGRITFTPGRDYAGPASFTYTATDGREEVTGTVRVAIAAVNDAPVVAAAAESFNGREDTPFSGRLLAATDADGDALSYALVPDSASGGRVTIDAETGAFTFTPDADHHGSAAFRYVVADGRGGVSAEKLVRLDLAPVNDAPVADDEGGFVADAGKPTTISARTLLANDGDPDGDVLTITALSDARNGTVTRAANGDVVFTPNAGYSGPASFTYTVSDGRGGFDTATVGLVVRPAEEPALTINGTERTDILRGSAQAEAIFAKGGADLVLAGGGNDSAKGGDGWDALFGGDGDDRLWGEAGNDALLGEAGADTLDGGSGCDLLTGGAGSDRFVFGQGFGSDAVLDFRAGLGAGDVLDVSALGFADLAAVKDAAHECRVLGVVNTVIDAGANGTVTLVNVRLSQLAADDFAFG